jgi:Mycothiol maleylpyruvate isomerase N-terminal domain
VRELTAQEVRAAFLETAAIAAALLARPEVGRFWEAPSALRLLSVQGLAGHLVRGATTVEVYLDRPEPGGPPTSAAEYYDRALPEDDDITTPIHTAIRERGMEQAAAGPERLAADAAAACARLRDRLASEPETRLMSVYKETVLRLDDYLRTRLVELTLHIDDLCVSVGVPTPEMPAAATAAAVDALLDVARLRHGDLAVLRALARRERDPAAVLRVM